MQSHSTVSTLFPTLGLVGLAFGQCVIFNNFVGRWRHLEVFIPDFITLALVAGVFYLGAVYLVERCHLETAGMPIILLGAVMFRLAVP
jgi:hypothetical protein